MKKTLQKFGVFTLGLALVFPMFAPMSASAEITKDMCSGLVRDLTLGSTGSDVVTLQTFLEEKGYLTIPAGTSKGYFGALTRAGLTKYQLANAISPAAGYFGPITRGKLVATCVTTAPTPGQSQNNNNLDGGEASLESFDLSSGDDSDVKEGSVADIAEIEFDVEDGDILINRIDLQLVANVNNEEKDPWDTFESIRVMVDGKEIAEKDISSKKSYLNDKQGTIRLSNVKYKVDEGETVNLIVEIEAQNSVDGADTGDSLWTVNVLDDGIRAIDAEGIQQYVGDDSETVSFEVVSRGEDDELDVKTSSDDPDTTTLKVESDKKSDEHEIFAFDIKSGDSDIEFDTVQIMLESNVNVSNVVSDLILEIDGEEFDDWRYVSGGNGTSTRVVEFDIDGDYTLDADDDVTAVLIAEFKAANGANYSSGSTIKASIVSGAIEGEGADDVTSEGSASGNTHTLATEGIKVSLDSKSARSTGTDNKVGEFKFVVDVTAFEEEAFVELAATRGTTESNTGFNVVILDGNNNVVTTGTTTFSIDSDEDETSNGRVEIGEDDTVSVTVQVFYTAENAGSYKAQLYSVNHNETDLDADEQFLLVPVSTYRTAATYVETN